MIETKHVSKVYKMGEIDLEVIKDLNLSIRLGEFIAIVGPSGSGKSTLLNMLGALDVPSRRRAPEAVSAGRHEARGPHDSA